MEMDFIFVWNDAKEMENIRAKNQGKKWKISEIWKAKLLLLKSKGKRWTVGGGTENRIKVQ